MPVEVKMLLSQNTKLDFNHFKESNEPKCFLLPELPLAVSKEKIHQ